MCLSYRLRVALKDLQHGSFNSENTSFVRYNLQRSRRVSVTEKKYKVKYSVCETLSYYHKLKAAYCYRFTHRTLLSSCFSYQWVRPSFGLRLRKYAGLASMHANIVAAKVVSRHRLQVPSLQTLKKLFPHSATELLKPIQYYVYKRKDGGSLL